MKDIAASLVKELREISGMGMMDCKKALLETKGDIQLAVEELRKSAENNSNRKAKRITAEGVIASLSNNNKACMVEINCETDFVARDTLFTNFAQEVVTKLFSKVNLSFDELVEGKIEKERTRLIQELGENIVIRRVAKSNVHSDSVGMYLHSNKKICCIVSFKGEAENIAKDIAMHSAATDPLAIKIEDIPKEILDKEREIIQAQLNDNSKPVEVINKIIDGKMKKYLSEVTLIEQNFVKSPSTKIESLLQENKVQVIELARFEVGEGIELESSNFASEVMSQLKKD